MQGQVPYWPAASVIVLTRNRALALERALLAVLAQDYPNYEVIVVDNGSIDETREVVARMGVRYVFSPPEDGFALSRQRGVDAARGEIIAMCDDDCVPKRDWLRHLVQRLCSDDRIGLVGGQVINLGFPESKRFKGCGKIGRNGMITFVSDPREADYFGSANLAFKRSAFDAVGGYDAFFRGGLEEVDLALNMRRHGFRVVYEPSAVVEHHYTGVSFKGSHYSQAYSPDLARLYLYLKYFRPRTFGQWGSFLTYEIWLLGKELCGTFRGAMGESARAIAARAAIPRLLQEVYQIRQQSRRSDE
jgi:GT2 family glycosyltransferase